MSVKCSECASCYRTEYSPMEVLENGYPFYECLSNNGDEDFNDYHVLHDKNVECIGFRQRNKPLK